MPQGVQQWATSRMRRLVVLMLSREGSPETTNLFGTAQPDVPPAAAWGSIGLSSSIASPSPPDASMHWTSQTPSEPWMKFEASPSEGGAAATRHSNLDCCLLQQPQRAHLTQQGRLAAASDSELPSLRCVFSGLGRAGGHSLHGTRNLSSGLDNLTLPLLIRALSCPAKHTNCPITSYCLQVSAAMPLQKPSSSLAAHTRRQLLLPLSVGAAADSWQFCSSVQAAVPPALEQQLQHKWKQPCCTTGL